MKNGKIREDIKLPDGEIGDNIKKWMKDGKEIEITIMSVLDYHLVQEVREISTR